MRLAALAGIGAVVLAIGACMNVGERLAYHPSRADHPTPAGYEDVWFETGDGVRLHGWFIPARRVPPGERAPVVVHAHGNAGHVGHHAGFSSFIADGSVHVLAFDYRGYGRSDEAPMRRAALLEDTEAAVAYARSRDDVDPDRVGLLGVSLGGAFALPAAAKDPGVRAVATLSTFLTWRGVAHDWVPVLGAALIRAGQDPVDAVAGLGDRPLLIVHGDADRVIRVRHARVLHERAQEAGVDATLLVVPGADHNRIIDQHAEARDAIAGFFETHLGANDPDAEESVIDVPDEGQREGGG